MNAEEEQDSLDSVDQAVLSAAQKIVGAFGFGASSAIGMFWVCVSNWISEHSQNLGPAEIKFLMPFATQEKYATFEDWYEERESFSLRAERLVEQKAELKAAFEAARKTMT